MRILLYALLGLILFVPGSCTVEKRRYLDGYHVEWNHRSKKSAEVDRREEIFHENALTEVSQFSENVTQPPVADISPRIEAVISSDSTELAGVRQESTIRHKAITHDPARTIKSSKEFSRGEYSASKFPRKNSVLTARSLLSDNPAPVDDLILLILAIFLSPLAVYLHEGAWNGKCWLNLLLFLLCIFPGIVHALIVIFG